jgi:hypothetical protein
VRLVMVMVMVTVMVMAMVMGMVMATLLLMLLMVMVSSGSTLRRDTPAWRQRQSLEVVMAVLNAAPTRGGTAAR